MLIVFREVLGSIEYKLKPVMFLSQGFSPSFTRTVVKNNITVYEATALITARFFTQITIIWHKMRYGQNKITYGSKRVVYHMFISHISAITAISCALNICFIELISLSHVALCTDKKNHSFRGS